MASIIVRIPFMFWPMITDEGGYAYTAYWWFKGYPLYSNQLWFDRPQGIFLIYKLGMVLLGTQPWAIRLWGSIWAAGTSVFLYLIAKRLSNNQYALVTASIYVIFSAMPQIEGFTSNGEIFALFPATVSVYFLLLNKYGFAGFFISLSFLMKPTGGTIIIIGIIWLIYNKENWINYFQYILGVSLLIFVAFLHGAITVGILNYWFALAGYRINLPSSSIITTFENLLKTSIVWFPLLILFAFGYKHINSKIKAFLLAWIFSSLLGVALGKNWEYHYFIQVIPPLAFGSSFGFIYISRKKNTIVKFACFLLIILPILFFSFFIIIPPDKGAWIIYQRPGYQKASEITQYIIRHTQPEDTIYVAFYEAEYYYLSNRRSSVPYIYKIYLSYIPGAYDSVIFSIKNGIPKYIVALDPPFTSIDPQNRFQQALDENYYIETYIQGTPIYKRRALTPTE